MAQSNFFTGGDAVAVNLVNVKQVDSKPAASGFSAGNIIYDRTDSTFYKADSGAWVSTGISKSRIDAAHDKDGTYLRSGRIGFAGAGFTDPQINDGPDGWSIAKTDTGQYRISTNGETVIAQFYQLSSDIGFIFSFSSGGSFLDIATYDESGTLADRSFDFLLVVAN